MNQSAMALGTLMADATTEPEINTGDNDAWMDIGDDDDDEEDGYVPDISHKGGKYMDAVESAMDGVLPAR